MKRTVRMVLLLAIVMAFIVPVLTDAVTQTALSYTGTFNGTNSPIIITVGGNCPPVNAYLEVTGKCEGTNSVSGSCSSVPNADADYGIFQSAYASASCGACSYSPGCSCGVGVAFSTGESCGSGCYCSGGMGGCGGFYFWWNSCSTSCGVTTSKPANQGTAVSGCGDGTSVTYTPCTKNPQVAVGAKRPPYSLTCGDWRCSVCGGSCDVSPCPSGAHIMSGLCYGYISYFCYAEDTPTGTGSSCCPASTPVYNSADGLCYSSKSIWKYSGLVKNTTTISIPIGTNSNPSSSTSGDVGVKVPIGNLVLGDNILSMSALGLNKFDYTLYWTEETSSGGGDGDGDGYYSSYSHQCTLGNDCDDHDPNVNPGHLEVPGNEQDDNCDRAIDILYINSMADITANCPYDSATKTYSCTGGWKKIVVNNPVSLPVVGCYSSGGDTFGCTATKIILKARDEVSAGTIYSTNYGGPGGSITIEAKKITANSLNTYGSGCHGNCDYAHGYRCGSNSGGPITLTADTISVGSLNANDGSGLRGNGGTITVIANITTISSISSAGAGYECGYNYGYDDGPGSGGYVNIKSKTATLGHISLSGASSNYAGSGGSGGSARLEVDDLTLSGGIDSNGASRCGSGGSVTLLSSDGKISGGVISALGQYEAPWWEHSGCSGSNGYFRIGSDYLKSIGTLTTNGPGSGGSIKLYLDTYNVSSVSSGSVAFVSNNTPPDRAFISAGSLKISGRSKTALFGFNTSVPDLSAKSFQVKIKEMSGAYFKTFGYEWSETGTITQAGKVSTEVGRNTPITGFMGGKKYYFELTTSTDAEFDGGRCTSGAAACSSYDIGFVEWS